MAHDVQSLVSANRVAAAAIKRASAATGAGFDYLMKTALRESSLDASANAATSTAAGLFQFIEQTWFGAIKTYGARHGLAAAAADITTDASGKFTVADAARRAQILDLRYDANASSALAGELTQENARHLEARLGRAVSAVDLYTAHFLGPAGAVKLLSAAANAKAADLLPAAAKANAPVFYDGARAKTVGEVIASIAVSVGEAAAAAPANAVYHAPSDLPVVARQSRLAHGSAPVSATTTVSSYSADAYEAAPSLRDHPVAISAPARLSLLAMSILQALDPTRLSSGRSERD